MLRPLFISLIALIACCSLSPKADAALVILLSGERIYGQIVERTELQIMVDDHRSFRTFYLGEIASIDGKKVDLGLIKAVNKAMAQEKRPVVPVPYYNDEQDSLIRFMNIRNSSVADHSMNNKVPAYLPKSKPVKSTALPVAAKTDAKDPNPARVVSTTDGGLIVVAPGKIIKYDKDLNIIKQVSYP